MNLNIMSHFLTEKSLPPLFFERGVKKSLFGKRGFWGNFEVHGQACGYQNSFRAG
jgi:hypothetical protein